MTAITIESGRLRLVSAAAPPPPDKGTDWTLLSDQLGASIPRNWPPEGFGEPGWLLWGLIFKHPVDGSGALAGVVGQRRCPDQSGDVEVRCTVLEQYRRRGIAAEAVGLLIGRIFRDPAPRAVVGETFPDLIPWIGVMIKNGMKVMGPGSEPGSIRYGITRDAWRARFPSVK